MIHEFQFILMFLPQNQKQMILEDLKLAERNNFLRDEIRRAKLKWYIPQDGPKSVLMT